jgi:hypothetical protein
VYLTHTCARAAAIFFVPRVFGYKANAAFRAFRTPLLFYMSLIAPLRTKRLRDCWPSRKRLPTPLATALYIRSGTNAAVTAHHAAASNPANFSVALFAPMLATRLAFFPRPSTSLRAKQKRVIV